MRSRSLKLAVVASLWALALGAGLACVSPAASHVESDIRIYNDLGKRLDDYLLTGRRADGTTMTAALVQGLRDELAAQGDELNAQARGLGVSLTALPLGRADKPIPSKLPPAGPPPSVGSKL